MALRASSRTTIDSLITNLSTENEVARETAVTRLTVLGLRALDSLTTLIRNPEAPAVARAAGLRAIEGIGDARSIDLVLQSLEDPAAAVAEAAAGAARMFLRGPRGADVVDRLTAVALDRQRGDTLRLAAIRSLSELDTSTLKPLYRALAGDPSPVVAGFVAHPDGPAPVDDAAWLAAAVEGEMPDEPERVRKALAEMGGSLALPLLHKAIERVREREEQSSDERRPAWTATRGVAHVVLANRGSRLALYDLRETFEKADAPLPLDYLTALREVGDASCLEAVAAAHARATDEWWRGQLLAIFHAIAAREGLTRRHAVMKRIDKRWPGIFAAV